MITINLLPEEFRAAEKKSSKYPVIPIAIGAGVLFILLTIFFYFDYISANISLNKLNKESVTILPQSQRLKQLDTEVQEILKPENVFLNRFVTADRPATPMLSWVSEFLPPAAWLTELKLTREGEGGKIFIKGMSIPTKEKSSIEQIEAYVHQLKAKMPDANLSLTTSRQNIKNVEVTEFVANLEWGMTVPVKS